MTKLDKNLLSKKELAYFWELLLKKRAEIVGDVSQMEKSTIKKDPDDQGNNGSTMPIHMADIGSDNFEQDFTIGLIGGERKLLDDVNEALQRIKNGTYGICKGTEVPISRRRLEAKPWAKYSIEYATLIEKGLADEIEDEAVIH